MSPRLDACPSEVTEEIATFLALDDIFSLRLVSRAIADKTTQNHFKSYFSTKHVDITTDSLEALVEATRPGSLGCCIQRLVLVGILHNGEQFGASQKEQEITTTSLPRSETNISLLSKALRNIMVNGAT